MVSRKMAVISFVLVVAVALTSVIVFFSLQNPYPYRIKNAFPKLVFDTPIGIYDANDGTNRLFVNEKKGVIWVFENSPNVKMATVFLDIKDRVQSAEEEQGLLGVAFPPDYKETGIFYVDYVSKNPQQIVIASYHVSSDPNQADEQSEKILLEIPHPKPVHNAGQIAFGNDGYLYIAVGDGSGVGDSHGNAQNREVLLGKILRIDVSSGASYTIPSDNPFAGNTLGYREEIYAYGFRNPWRFSFDTAGRLWVADVGRDRMEEIDLIEKGKNYGWNIMEGTLCFSPENGCDPTGLELPIWEYPHDSKHNDCIIGGFVYEGSNRQKLVGEYVYGDATSGRIWALNYTDSTAASNLELVNTKMNIASFGIDHNNELYFCVLEGKIYQLEK